MSSRDLWYFVRENGLNGWQIAFLLVGGLSLLSGVWDLSRIWRIARHELTKRDLVTPLSALLISAFCFFMVWGTQRQQYLLRPGAGRYTVSTVFKYGRMRGRPRFVVEFWVGGQRYQTDEECDKQASREVPCPARGTRFFVYFAPETPGTCRVLEQSVSDSVRVIPPLGWAKLP